MERVVRRQWLVRRNIRPIKTRRRADVWRNLKRNSFLEILEVMVAILVPLNLFLICQGLLLRVLSVELQIIGEQNGILQCVRLEKIIQEDVVTGGLEVDFIMKILI